MAVCLAANYPDRVGDLVLTGAPLVRLGPGKRPSAGFRLARWLHSVGALSDGRMEWLKKSRGSSDYRNAEGVMRDVLVKVVNESYEGQLSRVRNRVHLLWGGDDHEVPVAVAETALALLADSRMEVLPGVGHLVPVEAPAALRAAIDRAMA